MNQIRVLVIEDDMVLGQLLAEALRAAGYIADHAIDGGKGLAAFRFAHHSIVVSDIIMPEYEGLETLLAIRKESPETKLIAISGGGRIGPTAFLSLARSAGADLTLQKPFRPSVLVKAVSELCHGACRTA